MPLELPAKVECPPPDELRKLLRGRLPDARSGDLTNHLDDCTDCRDKLELLADGDTNLSGVVKHIDQSEPPKTSSYWKAFQEIEGSLTATYPALPGQLPGDKKLEFLQPTEAPGKLGKLGDFEVIREIGRGGMGIVLQAYDPHLEREVALKVLDPQLGKNETARQRFCREARAAAAVSHENLVAVYSVHEEQAAGLPYFVMQLVVGETLEQRIRREGKLDVDSLTRIAWQAAQGLSAAHTAGLIHRDIKPGNILLEGGTDKARLTDFGLARAAEDLKLTRTGFVAGTPLYMAPEQAKGDDVDARADLFSLGCVMYEALAGKPPFDGATPLAVLRRVADEAHPRLARINPEVPDWLEDTIDELLEKDPAKRIQTAGQLANILASHFSGEACPVIASPVECTVARTASRIVGSRRRRALTTALVLGLPFLLGGLMGGLIGHGLAPKHIEKVVEQGPPVIVNGNGAMIPAGPEPLRSYLAGQGAVFSVAVDSEGKIVAAGLEDGSFVVIRLEDGYRLHTKSNAHAAPILAVDMSADGKSVLTASDDGNVTLWDISSVVREIHTFVHPSSVRSAAISTGGTRIATGDRAGVVRIWDIASGNCVHQLEHGGTITSVAFDPTAPSLVSTSTDKTAKVWDISNGSERITFSGHKGTVYGAAFSPDGSWIATAGWDRRVLVWDSNKGDQVHELKGHDEGVLAVAFSCCGKILASACQDGSVRVWNAYDSSEIHRFTRHKGTVYTVKFLPGCTTLLTGGLDGTLKTWNAK